MKTIKLGFGFARREFIGRCVALVAAASLAFMPIAAVAGAVAGVGGKKSLKVYSSNVYVGALIDRVLEVPPGDLGKLLEATTLCFQELVQANPPKRMNAIAAEIAARTPDVVGLVELYEVQLMTAPNQFTTLYNYKDLVLEGLAAQGAHYKVAVTTSESDIIMPILLQGQVTYVRIIDREAILVRDDLPPGQLSYRNPQSGQFETHVVVPGLGLEIPRGWCSIDMFVRGQSFRLVCAHLETEDVAPVQYAQAVELMNGPCATELPVVLIGDFNTDPLGRDGSSTYPVFTEGGFADAWDVMYPNNPGGGLTWGHDPALTDLLGQALDRRIDLILYKGLQCTVGSFEVVDPQIGSTTPLWFSDHAAVYSELLLGNPESF